MLPFIDNIGDAYGRADLAVARAGGSVWELAAAGVPTILVPGDFATASHQAKNAQYFADAGGAVIVREGEIGRVPALVDELLADPERLRAMSDAMRSAAKPDAAERIADELVKLATAHR
jgi:UDP-N-acetylglucosamine--N-acetylmuramyl-(pentapeptide) pyrophosphoryl-undecaprenol N-acetylglucosamine transferase